MPKIANRDANIYTSRMEPFRGSSLYAEKIGETYVVFSYGPHFPLYIHKDGKWYENEDKYSPTTAKHKTQARPTGKTEKLPTVKMKELL